MGMLKKHGAYETVPLEERCTVTGTAPGGVTWVDANKGDKGKPERRCRLVAKEIKRGKREDLFAATVPLEAKKVLFSLFASMPEMRLDFIDVVRAYFHAKARRDACVDLPRKIARRKRAQTQEGDVRREGCSPELGAGVH